MTPGTSRRAQDGPVYGYCVADRNVRKILIDHVVLGVSVEDVAGYPSFLVGLLEMLEGASVGGILLKFWVSFGVNTLSELVSRC